MARKSDHETTKEVHAVFDGCREVLNGKPISIQGLAISELAAVFCVNASEPEKVLGLLVRTIVERMTDYEES